MQSYYIESAPYLNTCITYLITLSRLSAPYLNTCYLNTLSRLHILIHCRTVPYLNTWPEVPSRLSDSIAKHEGPPPPPPQHINSDFHYWRLLKFSVLFVSIRREEQTVKNVFLEIGCLSSL